MLTMLTSSVSFVTRILVPAYFKDHTTLLSVSSGILCMQMIKHCNEYSLLARLSDIIQHLRQQRASWPRGSAELAEIHVTPSIPLPINLGPLSSHCS